MPSIAQRDNCPKCGASWVGKPIPSEHQYLYEDGRTHFSRLIGIEYPERYDGVWEWRCPDCGATFPREDA